MNKKQLLSVLLTVVLVLMYLFLSVEFESSAQSTHTSTTTLRPNGKDIKVVMVLVDAGKYSYAAQYVRLLGQMSDRERIRKCQAGLPTMTTQRLEALMTGSNVFSTANILDSFFSTSVGVDNLLSQLKSHNKSAAFVGDDTWGKLFPFTSSVPCPNTFDIWDWDDCDDLIYQHLLPTLHHNHSLTIAHFLALDHIGHSTSSITHPAMTAKKQLISAFISKLKKQISDDTVLMVTGDHGMRDDGNHGGSSQAQTDTFLYTYYKGKDVVEMHRQNITQVDITTTLSVLLKVPVPTNSVGIPFLTIDTDVEKMLWQVGEHLKHIQTFSHLHCQELPSQPTLSQLLQFRSSCLSQLEHTHADTRLLMVIIVLFLCVVVVMGVLVEATVDEYVGVIVMGGSSYFSWCLIRNSITYFTLAYTLLSIYVGNGRNSMLGLLLLLQLQSQAVGEYAAGIGQLSIMNEILLHPVGIVVVNTYVYIYLIRKQLPPWMLAYIGLIYFSNVLQSFHQYYLPYLHTAILIITLAIFLTMYSSLARQEVRLLVLGMLCMFADGRMIYLYVLLYVMDDSGKYDGYVCYMWAHLCWWVLGTKYQYSSIDIKRSYIFSQQYHALLNPICLCVYMMIPYALPPIYKLTEPVKQFTLLSAQHHYHPIRWLFLPLCGIISTYINLVINHQQILYTVVYVPMSIIQSYKVFLFLICAILAMILY